MAIADVISYMQCKYEAMTYINKAPDDFTAKIPQTYLPFAWTYAGEIRADLDSGIKVASVEFVTPVLVFVTGNATGWRTGPATAHSILVEAIAYWRDNRTLGGTVKTTTSITGGIVDRIQWWDGLEYFGVMVNVTALIVL